MMCIVRVKWKRLTLAELNLEEGEGIYIDMNALRPGVQKVKNTCAKEILFG